MTPGLEIGTPMMQPLSSGSAMWVTSRTDSMMAAWNPRAGRTDGPTV